MTHSRAHAQLITMPAPAAPAAAGAPRLSPSQVGTLFTCAAKWYYKHALKLPDPTSPQMAIGRAVGAGCAAAITAPDTALETFESTFRDAMAEVWPTPSEEEWQRHHDRAAGMFQTWVTQAAPSIGSEAETERHLEGQIGGIPVKAYADIITETGTVIELKTAAKKPATCPDRHRLQAITYAMLAECDQAQVHILHSSSRTAGLTTFAIHAASDENRRYGETIYAMAADQIQAGIFPPRRDSEFCGRQTCPYHLQCIADHGGEVRP